MNNERDEMPTTEGLIAQWERAQVLSGFIGTRDPVIVYRDPARMALASAVIEANKSETSRGSRIRTHFDLVNGFAVIASPDQSARVFVREQVEELHARLR
jgi:hypothetical protein